MEVSQHRHRFSVPSLKEQTAYFATGALAGLSTLPIELTTARHPLPPAVRNHLLVHIPRAGFRFWMFDLTKTELSALLPGRQSSPRTALIGAMSGFSGGLAEVTYQSLAFQRCLPGIVPLANQAGKLFFCFGTYTFLSTSSSDRPPLRPFWYCWFLGAIAGAIGSGILAGVEGAKGQNLAARTGKGSLSIGTVIAVQVTTCAKVLECAEA